MLNSLSDTAGPPLSSPVLLEKMADLSRDLFHLDGCDDLLVMGSLSGGKIAVLTFGHRDLSVSRKKSLAKALKTAAAKLAA